MASYIARLKFYLIWDAATKKKRDRLAKNSFNFISFYDVKDQTHYLKNIFDDRVHSIWDIISIGARDFGLTEFA